MSRPKGLPKTGGRKPGSKNKLGADVRTLAQEHTIDAVNALVHVLHDKKAPHAAKVMAARELLDRGHGKSVQGVEVTGKDGGPLIVQWQS